MTISKNFKIIDLNDHKKKITNFKESSLNTKQIYIQKIYTLNIAPCHKFNIVSPDSHFLIIFLLNVLKPSIKAFN